MLKYKFSLNLSDVVRQLERETDLFYPDTLTGKNPQQHNDHCTIAALCNDIKLQPQKAKHWARLNIPVLFLYDLFLMISHAMKYRYSSLNCIMNILDSKQWFRCAVGWIIQYILSQTARLSSKLFVEGSVCFPREVCSLCRQLLGCTSKRTKIRFTFTPL